MNWQEHVEQSELLLRETQQDFATAQREQDLKRIAIGVQMAIAHALIAEQKRALS